MLMLVRDGIITNVSKLLSAASDELLKTVVILLGNGNVLIREGKMNNGKRTRIHPERSGMWTN